MNVNTCINAFAKPLCEVTHSAESLYNTILCVFIYIYIYIYCFSLGIYIQDR